MRHVIEGFIGQSASHRPVSDHCHDRPVLRAQFPGAYHSERRADGSGAVPCIKGITGAFLTFGETAHSAELPEMIKLFSAPCQKLMGIGLMSHIPDDLVLRQIQGKMQRHGQFHCTQITGQMTARFTDLLDQELPDLRCKVLIGILRYFLNIIRFFDTL